MPESTWTVKDKKLKLSRKSGILGFLNSRCVLSLPSIHISSEIWHGPSMGIHIHIQVLVLLLTRPVAHRTVLPIPEWVPPHSQKIWSNPPNTPEAWLDMFFRCANRCVMKCRFSLLFPFLAPDSPFDAHLLDTQFLNTHLTLTRRPFPFHMVSFSHYCSFIVPSQYAHLFTLIVFL